MDQDFLQIQQMNQQSKNDTKTDSAYVTNY